MKNNIVDNQLNRIKYGIKPQVLLLGNGLNRLNGNNQSWEAMIKGMLNKYNNPLSYSEIQNMPASMQVIVATNDSVDKEMNEISSTLLEIRNIQLQNEIIDRIADLNVDTILTSNYSYELEEGLGLEIAKNKLVKNRIHTKQLTEKERKFGLFSYRKLSDKAVFHIHGEACSPKGMIMGSYYYGKLSREIQNYVTSFMRRYKYFETRGLDYDPKSWVDYFLLGDVFILGSSMYLCEEDLWWLLCCKKNNFPDTKVIMYGGEDVNPDTRKMLVAYNCKIDDKVQFSGDFAEYYFDAINDMEYRIKGE